MVDFMLHVFYHYKKFWKKKTTEVIYSLDEVDKIQI